MKKAGDQRILKWVYPAVIAHLDKENNEEGQANEEHGILHRADRFLVVIHEQQEIDSKTAGGKIHLRIAAPGLGIVAVEVQHFPLGIEAGRSHIFLIG